MYILVKYNYKTLRHRTYPGEGVGKNDSTYNPFNFRDPDYFHESITGSVVIHYAEFILFKACECFVWDAGWNENRIGATAVGFPEKPRYAGRSIQVCGSCFFKGKGLPVDCNAVFYYFYGVARGCNNARIVFVVCNKIAFLWCSPEW